MPESITWKCWGIHVHVGCPLFQTIYRSSTLVCHFGTYSTNVCDELHVIVHVHAEAILKDWKQYDFKFSGVLWIHNINCHFYTTVHVCRNAVCMCVCVCVCACVCVCVCVCWHSLLYMYRHVYVYLSSHLTLHTCALPYNFTVDTLHCGGCSFCVTIGHLLSFLIHEHCNNI